jgi:hypothetical protein
MHQDEIFSWKDWVSRVVMEVIDRGAEVMTIFLRSMCD